MAERADAGGRWGAVPGVLLAAGIMLAALPIADGVGRLVLHWQGVEGAGRASPLSPVLVAIVLGLLLRNALRLPAGVQPGIQFCVTKVLRLGIVLIGIKLSLLDVGRLGLWGVPIVLATIGAGLLFTLGLSRLLGLSLELGLLLAAGSSICGITAILSTAAVIRAQQRDVAYAVANIGLFGLAAMLVYPQIAPHLLGTSEQIGIFFGTAIHDTSQVIGAGLTYKEMRGDDAAFKAATVTKLTRNLFLAAVIPLMALLAARRSPVATQEAGGKRGLAQYLPLFVLGFIAMSLLRTLGDAAVQSGATAGLLTPESWKAFTSCVGDEAAGRYLLGTAMAAVGLNTSLAAFRGVGVRPFIVGFGGAVFVALTGLAMSWLLGARVQI